MYKSSPKNTTRTDFDAVHKGSTLVKVPTGLIAGSGFGPPPVLPRDLSQFGCLSAPPQIDITTSIKHSDVNFKISITLHQAPAF